MTVSLLNNSTGVRGLIAVDKIGNRIRFFDPESFREIHTLEAKNHHEVEISADHRTAYVSEFGKIVGGENVDPGGAISIIDLEMKTLRGRIDTGPNKAPHAMRLDRAGRLWVACEESGSVAVIDLESGKLAESIPLCPPAARTHMLELLPDDSKLYVSSKNGPLVVFDIRTRKTVATLAVAKGTEGIAVAPDGKRMVVAENAEQRLLVVDTERDVVVDTIPLLGAVLSDPRRSRLVRLRFSPDGRYLVSTNYVSGVVHIHDGHELRDHSLLPVAKGPQGIAYTADGKRAIIANHDSGIATVVDLASRRVTGWFEAGNGIETLTFY
jgi:DNA-binding beta-propeller fold protein YncE